MGAGVCRVGWGPGGPLGHPRPELTLTLLTVGGFFASWWLVAFADVVGIPAVGGLPDRWAASLGQVVRWEGPK